VSLKFGVVIFPPHIGVVVFTVSPYVVARVTALSEREGSPTPWPSDPEGLSAGDARNPRWLQAAGFRLQLVPSRAAISFLNLDE
jgi:hypothetical protein